jgi:Icc-related predicted phosphoesterase
MVALHTASIEWLGKSLKQHKEKQNVVITHFPPIAETKNPNFNPNIIDAYFNNNLGKFIAKHNITHWLYGHNHYSDAKTVGNTKFISNQRGYGQEFTAYNPGLLIDVGQS